MAAGNSRYPLGPELASGSVPGGLLGVIGVVLVLAAVLLIVRSVAGPRIEMPNLRQSSLQSVGTRAWGSAVGFSVGLTSVGSGSLITPFVMAVYPVSPAWVVGTDVFHAAILVTVTAGAPLRGSVQSTGSSFQACWPGPCLG